ncbi:hypothetical protein SB861_50265 [Paraburkholderia sp. SIMBA_049]
MDNESMLLYAVAAIELTPAVSRGWFRPKEGAIACVISRCEDVVDILLRLPDVWAVVPAAKVKDIHDDTDIAEVDYRFNRGTDEACCAVVSHQGVEMFVLLIQINAVEAALLPERLFKVRDRFGDCLLRATDSSPVDGDT